MMATPNPVPPSRTAVEEFQRDLQVVDGPGKWLRRGAIVVAFSLVLAATLVWRATHTPPAPSRFVAATIDVGDIVVKVQATGTVQPMLQVNVSAQASGRMVAVNVDVNSVVKKGDILAEIDPALYGAQVDQVGADLASRQQQVVSARTAADSARLQFERAKSLFEGNLASKADLENAKGQFEIASAQALAAQAAVGSTRALLTQSLTNVGHTKIRSPVDGIVISRSIDPGATIAANFQAPVLFVIAQDLKSMRVLADIDEADVAKVREGLGAQVVVDAFPGDVFRGNVRTLSYGPSTVNGVVTYTAYIDVLNPLEKLRPGMTATVTIRSAEAKSVVRVPNAALRFRPTGASSDDSKLEKNQSRVRVIPPNATGDDARVVTVRFGLTDGAFTEVLDEALLPGARVAVGETVAKGGSKAPSKGKLF